MTPAMVEMKAFGGSEGGSKMYNQRSSFIQSLFFKRTKCARIGQNFSDWRLESTKAKVETFCLLFPNHLRTMAMKLKRTKNCLLGLSAAAVALLMLWSLQPRDLNKFANWQWNGTRFRADSQSRTEQMNGKEEAEARVTGLKSCFPLHENEANGKAFNHVFFLKVHKAGSTSVTNILYRFALTHDLNVALARKGLHITQRVSDWANVVQPLVPGKAVHYDILATHVVFNDTAAKQWLPRDTKYVAIVRQPFEQFVSAFYYYRDLFRSKRLQMVPGDDPIMTILCNLEKWDAELWGCGTMISNRMSCDFGVPYDQIRNRSFLQSYLNSLDRLFHLVMIAEFFNESLVLLKRTLSWSFKDILYIKLSNEHKHRKYNITPAQKENFRKTRLADFMLYEHFVRIFRQKVAAEGDNFADEVRSFNRVRRDVEEFCTGRSNVTNATLTVAASTYSPCFIATSADCEFLSQDFRQLTSRNRQSMRKKGVFL